MPDPLNPLKRVVAQFFPSGPSNITSISSEISANVPPQNTKDATVINTQHIFPLAESKTCEARCNIHPAYPSTIAQKIDRTLPLWGSVKAYEKHVLIATEGKSDWPYCLEDEHNTLGKYLWEKMGKKGKQPINLTNICMHSKNRGTDLLVLPDFDYISGVTRLDASIIVESLISDKWDKGLNIRKAKYKAVVLICSHKKRDRRCGIAGPILQQEFRKYLREKNLLRNWDEDETDSVGVFLCSHIGGHKFAGNVVIYRRNEGECIWLGRVEPCHVPHIVSETIEHGKVWPELLRGGFKGNETSW
ncbi:Actin patches distal protein 1 [Neolecta irregularis DAH-3]|uniref:Actin patches distal protein 1 n=1 Tax=Neolecta irregularis (strain DAH-3) TaxID=1198029 RepID=A0A1U7LK42_NEOID|nr:Actin patches distal protein 1 [Neolecta irregularis DAH-3]|eukprot:OLL22891.1 Actin patches distal protein 1 [Neolecta irregularis DAH-3]